MTKKIILPIIIIILLVVIIYQFVLKKEEPTFTLVEVVKGEVFQEVSETGQVQKGDKISLSFKNAGRIERIYVEVGEEVKAGNILAKLETVELNIKLQEAKAALSLVRAQLDKLLAGATQEEIKIAQTEVENKQVALDIARQNLEDAYEDALNTLDAAYLKAYNSQNVADTIQRTYFTAFDQEGIRVKENKTKIETAVSQIKSYLDTAKENPTQENIDSSLFQTKSELSKIFNALKVIRETCEEPNYRNVVSSTNKTSLNTQRTNINTASTNIADAQQTITSKKLAVDTAEGNLQAAEDDLALAAASPRAEDIDYYQAQVDQAQSQVRILENQIQDANLKSPVSGQITEIKKRVGELVQPSLQDAVITFLPADPFEIEVDIYEEDVVKVKIGNLVDISLVPFPGEIFQGKVISIDPAEKLIEGIVYYKVIITFEEMPEGVKPGMTADIVIKTESRENVLIIPEDIIQKKDSKQIVEVFKDGVAEDREIEIGLVGTNEMVEVISGLEEGEEVILR
jgi:RND family efflux transporter MFP subunit